MLKKEEFISFILEGPKQSPKSEKQAAQNSAPASDLMSFGFETPAVTTTQGEADASFAQRLLEASAFGKPDYVQTTSLIRNTDSVARHLPPRAAFWAKTPSRPYQTLLFEADISHRDLLAIPAFKSRKISHLDMVEDALARMVSEALEGFQRGGEGVTADVRKGRKEETLCIVSIRDERDQEPVRLICFGTVNAKTGGMETFHLTEQTRFWDRQLAKDHLGLLYERQFKKLGTANWQEAFTTSDERKQAEKLLEVCSKKSPQTTEIQEHVITLLDTIAKGFGLKCKSGQTRRLQAFALPSDHDIGIDPEELSKKLDGKNPFGGVTLRDEKSRLLGYIVYPLKKKEDATQLRSYLKQHNRFHNVLVVFPDGDETTLELWQGQETLSGKLRKDHGFKDAAEVVSLLSRFFVVSKAKVRNPMELAQELAYRARYLRKLALMELEDEPKEGPLRNLYKTFKKTLVHDQTEGEFADAFAQTLTYGLLTSRWIGNERLAACGDRFTRQNALKYLPSTSNFLGELFKTALEVNLSEHRGRLLWLVDDIADLLDRINVTYIFGIGDKNSDQATDPVIHFYEPFLAAYDNELRNKRGVYFTPRPVVSFIVRSVHELLQTEFGLEDGLASTATWGDMQRSFPDLKLPKGVTSTAPFVCILDPATGTGTFLYECIEVIERTMKEKWCNALQKDSWNDPEIVARWREYVPKHLLTRLYGYELMMASYSIAHLKLAFKLGETGYHVKDHERLHVYLTDSLEPASDIQEGLPGFVSALAREAEEVNGIKRQQRFTVVVGNPPYAYDSSNTGAWISSIIRAYFQVDGKPLGERNPKGLLDDYVKFLRFGQHSIDTSGVGILALITNHGYLDNPTFRGMRQSLTSSFNYIYLVDMHGNLKKKEKATDGSKDVNVFDIQQGVAIGIFSNSLSNNKSISHYSLLGGREIKYKFSSANTIFSIDNKNILSPSSPDYLFCKQDDYGKNDYDTYDKITDIFLESANGFKTHRDRIAVSFDKNDITNLIKKMIDESISDSSIRNIYEISDSSDWQLKHVRKLLQQDKNWKIRLVNCLYRPFDIRYCHYSRYFMDRPREKELHHALHPNICMATGRQGQAVGEGEWNLITVGKHVADTNLFYRGGIQYFPLYLYSNSAHQLWSLGKDGRVTNLAINFVKKMESSLGLKFVSEAESKPKAKTTFFPEDVFYYIYAILHSPIYRSRYADFLKIDFPKIPICFDLELFREICKIGSNLVSIQLFESTMLIDTTITKVVGTVSVEVEKISYSDKTVWLDKKQKNGFQGVTDQVWNFHIGGYQVCHKWLKDRKGRLLSDDDIDHYQKIIVAISETIRLMTEIDTVIDAHGGWPAAFQAKSGETK